ncbi:MAG TPA: VWA domain-containing protein [Vicinamibacterales bacterium]|nr:VWA domain-containing protein [Vicinamibacterales bacterium]
MPITRVAFATAAALTLLVSDPAAWQQTQFRVGVQTVPIYATVLDREGRLVPDLDHEHFEVYDNGKLQTITNFTADVQPITVVVMLDTSGSMTLYLDLLKQAAEQFVIRLLPDDRAKIGSFSDKILFSPTRGASFTGDRDALLHALRNDIQFGNPTRLWDAVLLSMAELSNEPGRRVVLVFTDGDDNSSTLAGRGDVIDRSQAENFMVYGIGYRSRYFDGRSWVTTRPDRGLRPLALESGGGYFELTQAHELGPTFTRVADELHRQYVLGFSPEVLDGKVHRLEVRVKVPGMTVRARQSYVAATASGAEAPRR